MPMQVQLLSHKLLLIIQRYRRLPLSTNSKVRSVIPATKRLKTGNVLKKVKTATKESHQLVLQEKIEDRRGKEE